MGDRILKIYPESIRDEPLFLKGVLEAGILDLRDDLVQPDQGISYALTVMRESEDLLVTGEIRSGVKVRCGRCGGWMPFPVEVKSFSLFLEPPFPEFIDLTPHLREDILLGLPIAPACRLDSDYRCPVTGDCFPPETKLPSSLENKQVWQALDKLKPKE